MCTSVTSTSRDSGTFNVPELAATARVKRDLFVPFRPHYFEKATGRGEGSEGLLCPWLEGDSSVRRLGAAGRRRGGAGGGP